MDLLDAILIVDDDADVLQAAELALAPLGGRIDLVGTLDDLAARVEAVRYDCVLLDLNFSAGRRDGGQGLAALAAITAADPAVAVVLMTSYGGVSLAVEALKQGAADFLLKPWRNDALAAAVRAAADRTRAMRVPPTLDVMERSAIVGALERSGGNVAQAANALGLSRPALYRRMARHGL